MARKAKKIEDVLEAAAIEEDPTGGLGESMPEGILDEEPAPGPEEVAAESTPDPRPEMTDPAWNEYVLTQFLADEVDKAGLPTADGLRRVSELLLGPIVEVEPFPVELPTPENGMRGSVKVRVAIAWEGDFGDIRRFGDIAEVTPDTNPNFVNYALSTAATKAEGRAYRKALKLRKVLTAEEKARGDVVTRAEWGGPGSTMAEFQHRGILKTLRDCGIDPGRYFQEDPRQISYATAVGLMERANRYFQDPDTIPESLKIAKASHA